MADPNSDPNLIQQAGNFAVDAGIDNAADGFINQAVDGLVSHVPGGDAIEQALNTEVDQDANNWINSEVSDLESKL